MKIYCVITVQITPNGLIVTGVSSLGSRRTT